MPTLHLIRHALPEVANYDNRFPGPMLGMTGYRQADWITTQVQESGARQIFASDFTRVIETMQPLLQTSDELDVHFCSALREREPSSESHESLASRVNDWWAVSHEVILATNTLIFSHCGPINMLLEIIDPTKKMLEYPYTSIHGCHTPIAGIWRIHFFEKLVSGKLIQCPIQ